VAQVLSDTGGSQTIQTDDGRIIVVPSGLINAGGPPPPPPGAMPQGVLDFLSPPGALPPGGLPSCAPGELTPPPGADNPPQLGGGVPARVANASAAPAAPAPTPGPASSPSAAPELAAAPQDPGLAAINDRAAVAQQSGDVDAREQEELSGVLTAGINRRQQVMDEAQKARAADMAMLQKRTDEIDAAIKENADRPVDPDRRWNDIGTGRRVLVAIAAALSGWGQSLSGQGGPNVVIQHAQAMIEGDIRAQMSDNDARARKVGFLGQQLDRYRNVVSDREGMIKARLAEEMERQAKEVEALSATYGSEKAKLRANDVAAQFRLAGANYANDAVQSQFTNDLALRKQIEDERHARKSEGLQGWSIAENRRQFDLGLKQKYDDMLLDAAAKEAAGDKAGAAAARKAAEDAYEKEIPNTVGVGGVPVKARSSAEAKELRNQQAGVEAGAKAIDEIVNVLQTGGPPTDILKSPAWQRIRSNEGALISAVNQAMLGGVVREGDIKFIRETFEGGSLSGLEAKLRDGILGTNAADGLLKTRAILERGYSDKLRSQDKDAKPYTVAPLTGKAPTPESPAGSAFRAVTSSRTPAEQIAGAKRSPLGEAVAGPNSPGGLAARAASELLFGSSKGSDDPVRAAEAGAGFNYPSVGAEQERGITILAAQAAGGDAAAGDNMVSLAGSGRPGVARAMLAAAADIGDQALLARIQAAAPPAELEAFKTANAIRDLANSAGRRGP
jgi:hypothetical protein